MTSPADATEIVPYLTTAAVIVYAQRFLKTTRVYEQFVAAMPGADKWAHRLVAGIGAFVAALGIHMTFAGDFSNGWAFSGTIPNGWELLHGLADFVKVFALQQWAYDSSKQWPTFPPQRIP
jgi:hypothetical protein